MTHRHLTPVFGIAMLVAATVPVQAQHPPDLAIEAPDALAADAERIRRFDRERLRSVMTLTGMTDPGPVVRVLLVPERSAIARNSPAWVAAFADASQDLVVLFPERIGSYPYGSLEEVLFHEVAHILTSRAAAGAPIPRWFNEGLASAAERGWRLETRTRFAWVILSSPRLSATDLEGLFAGDRRDVARAYVLADAIVRDLLRAYGPDAAARILQAMAAGRPFAQALHDVTGASVRELTASFWQRHQLWESWIGFAGHPFTIWSLTTLLALAAIWRHQRRRAARRQQWEQEERREDDEWEAHRRRYRIH